MSESAGSAVSAAEFLRVKLKDVGLVNAMAGVTGDRLALLNATHREVYKKELRFFQDNALEDLPADQLHVMHVMLEDSCLRGYRQEQMMSTDIHTLKVQQVNLNALLEEVLTLSANLLWRLEDLEEDVRRVDKDVVRYVEVPANAELRWVRRVKANRTLEALRKKVRAHCAACPNCNP
jgi:hypothetical protein